MRASTTDTPGAAQRFDAEKATFLRFAETLQKAQSAKQLLDLLQADIDAPYHFFDLLCLAGIAESVGSELALLLDEAIDEMRVIDE